MGFWADGFWADGFWADGFWQGLDGGDPPVLDFVLDLNTRIAVFVQDAYSEPTGDLTTLSTRYMNELPDGDGTQRMQQLIEDATDAAS